MLGCGTCYRCTSGRQHVCDDRFEIGVRNGWPGACAEKLLVPERALHALPDSIDDAVGALIEPAGNSLRAVEAALAGPGKEILIYGTGTIGLLCAQLAQAAGASVHLVGRNERTIKLAHEIGIKNAGTDLVKPRTGFDGIIDATNHKSIPHEIVQAVEPGGRVVYIGISGEPSLIDSRDLALKDVTAVGILSASPGLKGAIEIFARGEVDPRPLIAATISLNEVHDVFMGKRPAGAGDGPKIHIDPRMK
jgi:threonine dehydrogenase-like Zn-dependent dehydrogenase